MKQAVRSAALSLLILALPTMPALAQEDRTYTIRKGDTLWDISKRLFGDPFSWPKLWKLNNEKIPNPDLIYPSVVIVFSPGTTTELPSLALKDGAKGSTSDTVTDSIHTNSSSRKRSQEWRDLPPQSWELIQVTTPENVDEHGFDLKTRYVFPRTRGLELPWIAASDEIDAIGSISAARSENRLLTVNDIVYLREYRDGIEPGKILAITTEPAILKASLFGRKGYGYPILGKVRVIGKKDDVWIGQIQQASASIERRSCVLIENPPRAMIPAPVPAPEPIEANFVLERGSDLKFSAQHKIAFIDRGTNDGITEGMVLRAYQHRDPFDDNKITSADVVISTDVQVIQASEQFSLVLVIRSVDQPIDHGTRLVALTDVTDLTRQKINLATDVDLGETPAEGAETGTLVPTAPTGAGDDLDGLESADGLTDEERRNLEQLEKHKGGKKSDLEAEPQPQPTSTAEPESAPESEESTPSTGSDEPQDSGEAGGEVPF